MVFIADPKYLGFRNDMEKRFGSIAAEYIDALINEAEHALNGALRARHGIVRASKVDAVIDGFSEGIFHFLPDGNVGSSDNHGWLADNYGSMFTAGFGVSPAPRFVTFYDEDGDVYGEMLALEDHLDWLFDFYVRSMRQPLYAPREDMGVYIEDYLYPINRRTVVSHKKLVLDMF